MTAAKPAVKPAPPKKGTAHLVPEPKPRPPVPGSETRGIKLDLSRKDLSQVQRQLTSCSGVWHNRKKQEDTAWDDIHRARQEYRAFNDAWPTTLAVTAKTFADLCNDRGAIQFLANIRARSIFVPVNAYAKGQYLAAYFGVDRIEVDEDAPGAVLR